MSRYITAKPDSTREDSDAQIAAAAANGLMHWSECQTDGSVLDRKFFATREEAEKSAVAKSEFDEVSGATWQYEARSMWRDDDGDIVAAEFEDETGE